MPENWKPISIEHKIDDEWQEPIPTDYEVSDLGRVRHDTRVLRPNETVVIRGRHLSVPRLVAQNFLPTPPYPVVVVRMKDGNRANMAADNLYWALRPRLVANDKGHRRWSDYRQI